MEFPRRQFNLTVLADGTALATGGNYSGASLVDLTQVFTTPSSGIPRPANGPHSRPRTRRASTTPPHSSSPMAGSFLRVEESVGPVSNVGYLERNAQVFSPPYLFKDDGSGDLAPRPVISSAPRSVAYDAPMSIQTPSAASIGKVALMRLGSVTHSVNMEQRYVPLDYSAAGGQVNAMSPLNANIAPPGYYMLFLIGSDGVPSLAEMVRLDPSAPTRTCGTIDHRHRSRLPRQRQQPRGQRHRGGRIDGEDLLDRRLHRIATGHRHRCGLRLPRHHRRRRRRHDDELPGHRHRRGRQRLALFVRPTLRRGLDRARGTVDHRHRLPTRPPTTTTQR